MPIVRLIWLVLLISQSIAYCEPGVSVDITDGIMVGSGVIKERVLYKKHQYYRVNNTLWGCPCSSRKCIRKCCPQSMIMSFELRQCVPSDIVFNVTIYDQMNETNRTIKDFFIVSNSDCPLNHNKAFFGAPFYIQTNGDLFDGNMTFYSASTYCIDVFDDSLQALVCGSNKISVFLWGMIISMPFLFITFLVYLILPDKNVHQNALMLYVLTLLLAYILLVTINLSENLPSFFCTGAAYGTIFLFMVSFFWMNVICFDIWYTFSGGRGYIVSSRTSERKRFLIYTSYAIGIPILHVSVVGLLDTYMNEDSIHKPNIGLKKCFLDDGWPTLWYMYGEAAILIVINVIFFTLTALKIRQVKKETSMLKQNESKRHTYEKDKRRFNLFLKLFLAMGVNWSMEVISWLVNWQTADKYTYIWYITDFINAIYGGVIFFIFVFKKKIWKMLQKRYYNFIGKPHLARAVTTTTDIRTSNYSSSADTNLTERTNMTERIHNGTIAEESALHRA